MKLAFIGNCQVINMAACAQAMLPEATVHAVEPGDPLSLEPARDCDIAFIQDIPWLEDVGAAFPQSMVRKIPNFAYLGFQPDLVFASMEGVPVLSPGTTNAPLVLSPMGYYNSALVLYGWLNGLSAAATSRLFCDVVYEHLGYYAYTEPSRRHLIELGRRCDVDLGPLIDEWAEQGCFSYSINHPKLFVLRSIARAALERAGIKVGSTAAHVEQHDILAACIWPVYPEIGDYLGIKGDYEFKNHGTMDLREFIEGSFALYAELPKEKIRVERFAEQADLYRGLENFVSRRSRSESNPYSSRQEYCFWQDAVASVVPSELDPIIEPKFRLSANQRISTAGSCFAQHISQKLKSEHYNYFVTEEPPPGVAAGAAQGYGLFTARFGNIYTARQLLQLFQRSYSELIPADTAWQRSDGKFIDPFRPQLEPEGFSTADEVVAARSEHFAAVRRMFEETDLFIFTIGLTEAWMAKTDGCVFPVAPGVITDRLSVADYEFKNFTVAETKFDLSDFIQRFRTANNHALILFTVSPVPLVATYENRHVLVSTTHSKSVLRAAVGEMAQEFDFVDYFPSYEVITGCYNHGRYFENDLRTVSPQGIEHVMRLFGQHYLQSGVSAVKAPTPVRAEREAPTSIRFEREIAEVSNVICDEELLDGRVTSQPRTRSELIHPNDSHRASRNFSGWATKVDSLVDGVEKWLLPTLAHDNAATDRRRNRLSKIWARVSKRRPEIDQ